MKIVLVVHSDTVFQELDLHLNEGLIKGTLDNFIGVSVIFRLMEMINQYNIPVVFTKNEEIDLGGAKMLANSIDRDTIPIIVDVANVDKRYDCSIENIYKFSKKEINDIKDVINHRLGLKVKTKMYTGKASDEDDSWAFIEKGIKTLSYYIPVQGDFHTSEAWMTVNQLERATQGLKWLLTYFIG